jgi:hypothetical protein
MGLLCAYLYLSVTWLILEFIWSIKHIAVTMADVVADIGLAGSLCKIEDGK